ncbi:MAG: hypothetical protein R3331_02520 [Sulfurospirillaceae bacterium]|nr:hypothetical protein [Sulfurospirillaceae bacterium]
MCGISLGYLGYAYFFNIQREDFKRQKCVFCRINNTGIGIDKAFVQTAGTRY